MSANSIYCHILGANVSVVSSLNGEVTNVICPQFSRMTHGCLLKFNEAGGSLGYAARRAADQLVDTRGAHWEFVEVGKSPVSRFAHRIFNDPE